MILPFYPACYYPYHHYELFIKEFALLKAPLIQKGGAHLEQVHLYIADFLSLSTNYYFTALVDQIRKSPREEYKSIDDNLCEILLKEKKWREKWLDEPKTIQGRQMKMRQFSIRLGC